MSGELAIRVLYFAHLIIQLFFICLAALVLVWFVTGCARVWLKELDRKEEQRRDWQAKHRADGTELPQRGRGLCDNCERLCEKVYFLSQGGRLCEDCYRQFEAEAKN